MLTTLPSCALSSAAIEKSKVPVNGSRERRRYWRRGSGFSAVPVGSTLKPGQFSTAGRRESAALETGNISAYDPATGELMWRTPISGGPSAGTFSTGGNLVFAGDRQGTFYAFDAKTGRPLWQFDTGGAIRGGQITYQVNGTQYVALSSGANLVIAFALPEAPR